MTDTALTLRGFLREMLPVIEEVPSVRTMYCFAYIVV